MITTVLPLLLLGQGTSAAPTPAPLSQQQRFDAATQAAADGRCREAVSLFEGLEGGTAARKNPLAAAAISLRKGACLIRIGRGDEGEAAVLRALPQLVAAGASYTGDVRDGRIALSRLASERFDYSAAVDHARAALALSTEGGRLLPLMMLTQLTTFDPGPEPLAYAEEALALTKAHPAATKESVAVVQSLHARVLMNQGRYKEAYAELKDSLAKSGGLTLKVTLNDISVRSDLAIAAFLSGEKDSARRYLAYTGAGRMKDAPFATATYMDPPICGSSTGLKPDDFAIVEFLIDDDGAVQGVTPIYTTGGRDVALQFARAVSEWAWTAQNAKAIPPFFRAATRVELRCTAADQRPLTIAPLMDAANAWLGQQAGIGIGVKTIAARTAALQGARTRNDRTAVIALLLSLGEDRLVPKSERVAYLDEGVVIAREVNAPAAVQARFGISHMYASTSNRFLTKRHPQQLRAMMANPLFQSDPLSLATFRLLIAAPGYGGAQEADAEALLNNVIEERGLADRHPLKTVALLERANLLSRRGDLAAAQQAFVRTGLSEEQCALIGIQPVMRRFGGSSSDYPDTAMAMGFEGWTRTEFDIAADGSTLRQRVITAYPPFIFNEASTGIIDNSRYQSSFRPTGGTACSANTQSINFRLP